MRRMTGKALAEAIRNDVTQRSGALLERGVTPCLAMVRVGDRQDCIAYENSLLGCCEKAGIAARGIALQKESGQNACEAVINALNGDESVHGILLLRPLPEGFDEDRIARLLDPKKDVDGMTPDNLSAIFLNRGLAFAPCTAEAVIRLLKFEKVELEGKEAAVIGRSLVVGKPLAMMLLKENATVTVCHTRTRNLAQVCQRADILIAAAGQKHLVDGSFVKDGAVLVDVGIHPVGDSITGDIQPSAYEKAGAYTPVPGGIGSVTSWLLMEHVIHAALRAEGLL
jgi:methylenetetrahydrofolate dehydrogenase (NADP+) / methenyltetrahydrofolate cyclohydrolase